MSEKEHTPGGAGTGRIIAAMLAAILLLAALNVVNVVRLHRAQNRLEQYETAEAARLAEEEAERIRNADLPEKDKPAGEADAAEILGQSRVITHAMGGIDGLSGLNCLEGFRQSYNAGARVFEADFRQTSDGFLVLRHDWRGGWQETVDETQLPTREEFLAQPILEKYTPMSFDMLLHLMVDHPDICVITDTKFVEPEAVAEEFTELLAEARKLGLSYLFDRMYVQVYSQKHFQIVDAIYHFPHYIYTLYKDSFEQTEEAFLARADFAREHGIEAITMRDYQWDEAWRSIAEARNVKVYVHTVNDREAALELMRKGVSGVYSDTLLPSDLDG